MQQLDLLGKAENLEFFSLVAADQRLVEQLLFVVVLLIPLDLQFVTAHQLFVLLQQLVLSQLLPLHVLLTVLDGPSLLGDVFFLLLHQFCQVFVAAFVLAQGLDSELLLICLFFDVA